MPLDALGDRARDPERTDTRGRPVAAGAVDGLPVGGARAAGSERRTRDRRRIVRAAELSRDLTCAVIDKLNRGVLVIDQLGTVLHMNQAAGRMLRDPSGMIVRDGRLEFRARVANGSYLSYLAGDGSDGTLVLKVDGARPRGHYRLLVSRLKPESDDGTRRYHSVFIYEPSGGPRKLPERLLRQLYGLTPGEARLANQLFVGDSLVEAAAHLGISINTAKTALRRVFARCAVRSQTELVRLLSLGPRTL